jgi:opacity protein-like surface antigen
MGQMNSFRTVLAAAIAVAFLAPAAAAQQASTPFSVEVRGALAIPTGDIAEDDALDNGFGFEVTGEYRLIPQLAIYAGWDRFSFGLDENADIPDADVDVIDSGFAAGGKLYIPVAGSTSFVPWLRGGAIYNQVRFSAEGNGAALEFKSDRSLGFEAGVGLDAEVAPRLFVAPAVRYRQYSAEFDAFDELGAEGDVTYVSIGLGLHYHF